MFNRLEILDLVKEIKEERGLSYRDIAEITGLPQSYVNSVLFRKTVNITDETAYKLLYPLIFIEGLHGSDIPRTPKDPNEVKWSDPESKGWIPISEVRDMMHELRAELGTDWQKLADFAGMNRVVFTKGFQKKNKRFVTKATLNKYRKIASMARSLSPEAKKRIFTPTTHRPKRYVSRTQFIALLSNYRVDYGLNSWREVGDDIGLSGSRIYSLIRDKRPLMRESVYDEIIEAMMAAASRREARRGFVVGSIDAYYKVTDGGQRRKLRAKERASAA